MPGITAVTVREGLRDCFYDGARREFLIFFRDGRMYRLPRELIPEDDGSEILGVRVEHDGSAFVVHLGSGRRLEIPWDFVLYHLEPAYPYFKSHRVQGRLEEDVAARIGRRLRDLRREKGITTYELARRSGIHRPNISRIESGRHVPNIDTLMRLARALETSVVDLVSEASATQASVYERGPQFRRRSKKQTARR